MEEITIKRAGNKRQLTGGNRFIFPFRRANRFLIYMSFISRVSLQNELIRVI